MRKCSKANEVNNQCFITVLRLHVLALSVNVVNVGESTIITLLS